MNTNDPLGILALQETIKDLKEKLSNLEKVAIFGEELPVSEAMIIERTGIRPGTLMALRQDPKKDFRSYKVGKTVMYIPSEFTEDIKSLVE